MNEIKTAKVKPPLRVPKLKDILPSIILILASRASVMGVFPFGTAMFAAVYEKRIAYMGIAAVCTGIFTSAGMAAVPKYLIALMIYWMFTKIYRGRKTAVYAAVCGAAVAFGGAITLIAEHANLYDVFLLSVESVICGLMYIVFFKSQPITGNYKFNATYEEYISTAVSVGVIIAGFGGISFGYINLTNVFSVYAVMITALNSTVAVSGCMGLCIGFIASMATSESMLMMGIYGFCAVFASLMNCYKKAGCAVGYVCASAITLIYTKNMYNISYGIFDTFAGCVLFLITPRLVQEYFRGFLTKSLRVESVSPDRRMREYLTMRLKRAGEAFLSLHESFLAVSESRLKKYSDDIGTILDETADRVCSGCKMCGKCWQTDFRKTYKNVLELIGIIESGGMLTAENVPEHFCEKCVRADLFIEEINHVYELFKRDVMRRSDSVVTRNLISSQYGELCRLFTGMAGDIENGFVFLEKEEERIVDELDKQGIMTYEVSVIESVSGNCEVYLRLSATARKTTVEGVLSAVLCRPMEFENSEDGLSKYSSRSLYTVDTAVLQLPRSGTAVNGDGITVFTTGQGRFFAILADGMGSGREAQYESSSALRLLTSFLKSGFSIKTALGILNSSLCLNMNGDIYSTIDLLCINLYTGDAELYKIGSAETIIMNGDEIRTISSVSVPVGILSDIQLDKKTLKLNEGDTIVMMTDGITESGCCASGTDWIKKTVIKPFETTQALAKEIMDTALEKNRGIAKDDMSLIAIKFMGV